VKNSGNSVAVLAAFKVVGKQSNVELLPSLWSDNYVTMLPGETKILSVKVDNDYTLNDIKIEYKTYSSNKKTMVEVQKK
jgi:alpha/beta superfamily hydrolase